MAPTQTNSDALSHATKCARSRETKSRLMQCVTDRCHTHPPVSTCVRHMTSIIYGAMRHSVERNKEHTLLSFYPVYWDTNSLVVKSANSFTFNLYERFCGVDKVHVALEGLYHLETSALVNESTVYFAISRFEMIPHQIIVRTINYTRKCCKQRWHFFNFQKKKKHVSKNLNRKECDAK